MILSPNPASDKATMIINSSFFAEVITNVFDASGKLVHRQINLLQAGTNSIDLLFVSKAVSGIYFVQVSTSDETRTEKLVIQKK